MQCAEHSPPSASVVSRSCESQRGREAIGVERRGEEGKGTNCHEERQTTTLKYSLCPSP